MISNDTDGNKNMEINRYDKPEWLPPSRYSMLRSLWEHCFPEDSSSFCDYYFSDKMKTSRAAVIKKDGRICAMLHLNPYTLQVFDRTFPCAYIVGVGTHTDCRRQGLMGRLLRFSFQSMYKEGEPLTFLMPASEKIYTPYDFVYIGDQTAARRRPGMTQTIPVTEKARDIRLCVRLMNDWLAGYDMHTIRDETYVRQLIRELQSEDGQLYFLVGKQTEHSGRTLSPAPTGLYAEWGLKKRETRLLYGPSSIVEKETEGRLMMGRVIHAPNALRLFRSNAPVRVILRLSDRFIPENNGSFLWTVSPKESIVKRLDEAENGAPDIEQSVPVAAMDIQHLTDFLFGGASSKEQMSHVDPIQGKLLSDIITVRSVFLDEVV